MNYYRWMYKDSPRYKPGEPLEDKHVIIYMEQGLGDQIQCLRYVPVIKEKCKKVTVHAQIEIERIARMLGADFVEKTEEPLPDHDLHMLSFTLLHTFPIPTLPYIEIPEKIDLPEGFNIGIAWEGRKDGQFDDYRNCPLKHFKELQLPRVNLISLQPCFNDMNLTEDCEDMKLYASDLADFYDTGKLLNSVNLVVTVDTSVLHIAGAMGKTGYGLMNPKVYDIRWEKYPWYPTIRMMQGEWSAMMKKIAETITRLGLNNIHH